MSCVFGDQPLRLQLSKNGVIHAGSYQSYGGFKRWHRETNEYENVPVQKRIRVVCSRWRPGERLEKFLVSSQENITCKDCMKLMGLIEEPLAGDRFVIRKKSTGEFYKNVTTRCTMWADNITDAFFFKRKHTAEAKCKMTRYVVEDKLLTYSEMINWRKKNDDRGNVYPSRKRIMDPDLEVRKVNISLE